MKSLLIVTLLSFIIMNCFSQEIKDVHEITEVIYPQGSKLTVYTSTLEWRRGIYGKSTKIVHYKKDYLEEGIVIFFLDNRVFKIPMASINVVDESSGSVVEFLAGKNRDIYVFTYIELPKRPNFSLNRRERDKKQFEEFVALLKE